MMLKSLQWIIRIAYARCWSKSKWSGVSIYPNYQLKSFPQNQCTQSSNLQAQWEMVKGVIQIPMVDWKGFEALSESLWKQFTFSLHRCPITLGMPEAQGICYFSVYTDGGACSKRDSDAPIALRKSVCLHIIHLVRFIRTGLWTELIQSNPHNARWKGCEDFDAVCAMFYVLPCASQVPIQHGQYWIPTATLGWV